jgi:hypothetical protein
MSHLRDKRTLLPGLLLALLLLGAQSASLAHAYEHEPGTPQNSTCTACIAASQLGAACVDVPATTTPLVSGWSRWALQEIEFNSLHAITARQRGPPAAL